MTATIIKFQSRLDRELLDRLEMMPPREQRVWFDAIHGLADGRPPEEVYSELFIDLGYSPAAARRKIRARDAALRRSPGARQSAAVLPFWLNSKKPSKR
jgi:hypothetical protein